MNFGDYNDIYESELLRLVSNSADTANQYVIFTNINNDLFAINVAKVEELIQNKNLTISKGVQQNSILYGVAKVRDKLISLVDFDNWLDNNITSSAQTHKFIILCNYTDKKLGIMIKNVIGIQSIESKSLYKSSQVDPKTAFVAELTLGHKVLCNIFDFDRLVLDLFPDVLKAPSNISDQAKLMKKNKLILVAEDSKLIQIPIGKLLEELGYRFSIFENGKQLLDALYELDPNEVGLIISDIEMPIMNGIEMITKIKSNQAYENIPVVINTNMSNDAIVKQAQQLGVIEVVKKLDIARLNEIIDQYCLR